MKKLKVKDIHQDEITKEFDRLTEIDLEVLLSNRDDFTHTGCPACLSSDVTYQFEHQGLSYHRCEACELLYISPAPSEEEHLNYVVNSKAMEFWRENTPESMHISRLPMYEERVEFVKDWLKNEDWTPESSLELGAGNGEFAALLAESDLNLKNITLLEPQELEVSDPKINIIKGGFDQLEESEFTFDVVFAWELIEHILEPDNFLRIVKKALKPGSPFIFSTPNEKSLETRSLKTTSSNILFDHVRLYNPLAITKLLERNGFRVINISTPGQLDVERLQNYMSEFEGVFDNDLALKFILNNSPEITDSFQQYLCDSLASSHMRVIAISDGNWNGCRPSILDEVCSYQVEKLRQNSKKGGDTGPTNFNSVVLPHVDTINDPYPPKFMKYVLNDLVGVHQGKFLDLGGGWGSHTRIAASMGFDVISVDREPAAGDIPSLVCDIATESLPIEDNSMDVVFSKSFIEHFYVRELPHILGEVTRVLKPGGVCIFLTPDWTFNTKQFYQIFTHVTPYTRSSMEQCLKMYGFEDVWSKTLVQLPQVWDNKFLALLADITAFLPLPRHIGTWVRWSKERYLMGVGRKPS